MTSLEAIKGYVRGGALLAWHPPHAPQPSPQVESDEHTSPSAPCSVRCSPRLTAAAWATPSVRRHLRAGVWRDGVWLPQLECHRRMGTP
jgi:hypothetical protein